MIFTLGQCDIVWRCIVPITVDKTWTRREAPLALTAHCSRWSLHHLITKRIGNIQVLVDYHYKETLLSSYKRFVISFLRGTSEHFDERGQNQGLTNSWMSLLLCSCSGIYYDYPLVDFTLTVSFKAATWNATLTLYDFFVQTRDTKDVEN